MANPIRLFAEFKDDLGNDYRLNIHQAGWQVTPFEFNLGADGFTLRYAGDNENRMQAVIGSEVTFTLMENAAQHTSFLVALATSQDADFQISIYKDPDSTNVLFWTGVLLSEQIELQDEAYPIVNTLTAADELGNLQNILYNNDGNPYTGRVTLVEHLHNCIAKTRALHVYDSTDFIIQYANDFFPTTSFVSTNALEESFVNHSAFYNVDEDGLIQYLDTFTVLENIATTFNARIFYANGIFNFVPIGAVADDSTLTLHKITKSGLLAGITFTSDTEKISGTDFVKLAGNTSAFLPPLRKVVRTWQINANLPVAYGLQYLYPVGTQDVIGTEITDNDLNYSQGTTLRLKIQYEHVAAGGYSPPFFGYEVGRLVLRAQIKVGGLYYKNSLSFSLEPWVYGTYLDTEYIQDMNITDAAWSSSQGYFYLPITAGESYIDRQTGAVVDYQGLYTTGLCTVAPNGQPLVIDLPDLPSQESDISCIANVAAYDLNGNIITDLTSAGNYGKLGIAFFAMTGNATNGDELVYNANTGNNGREELQQPDVYFGSSDFNTDKNIFESSAGVAVINEWGSLANPTADAAIHSIGVEEVLAGQNDSTPIKRGGFFQTFLSPFNVLDFGGDKYLPFETSYTARSLEGDFEAFELISNNADIVTPEPEIIDTHEPQDDSEPVYDLRNIIAPETLPVNPNILRRMIQQPVTAIANRNAAVYNVTDTDYMMFNTWAGANGSSLIYLPTVTGNEGRTMQFHSDSTISANTYVQLRPFATDTGVTIDGAASYNFNHSYDGITILCHAGQWYIIQKKDR